MAIPDFQSIMLPLLQLCADGKDHSHQEATDRLSKRFKLTEDELRELLPSGRQRMFDNRIAWARSYMKQAGLIENTKRGVFRITSRGADVVASNPRSINIKFLRQFHEFSQWQEKHRQVQPRPEPPEETPTGTPLEQLENAVETLHRSLADELLLKLKSSSPSFFEQVVVDLLVKMGYGGSLKDAGQVLGKSGDGGIDGKIKEDRLGLDVIHIQAKRWDKTVPISAVREFSGVLSDTQKGVFITTSDFPANAREFEKKKKMVLIDGEQLVRLMIEHNVGVAVQATYEVKRLDLDYFEED